MDMTLLLGPADPRWSPSLAEVAQDFSRVLGFSLDPVPGKEMLQGGSSTAHAWLTEEPEEHEPFRSHPFNLDVTTSQDEVTFANALFDTVAEIGQYRVVLLLDSACARSTHFPCKKW